MSAGTVALTLDSALSQHRPEDEGSEVLTKRILDDLDAQLGHADSFSWPARYPAVRLAAGAGVPSAATQRGT
jgi:hypothetical protein